MGSHLITWVKREVDERVPRELRVSDRVVVDVDVHDGVFAARLKGQEVRVGLERRVVGKS